MMKEAQNPQNKRFTNQNKAKGSSIRQLLTAAQILVLGTLLAPTTLAVTWKEFIAAPITLNISILNLKAYAEGITLTYFQPKNGQGNSGCSIISTNLSPTNLDLTTVNTAELCANLKFVQYNAPILNSLKGFYSYIDTKGDLIMIPVTGSVTGPAKYTLKTPKNTQIKDFISEGVDFHIVKPLQYVGNEKDYFILYSRASDLKGTYPSYFSLLISNNTSGNFFNHPSDTLTLSLSKVLPTQIPGGLKYNQISFVNWQEDYAEYIRSGLWVQGIPSTTVENPKRTRFEALKRRLMQFLPKTGTKAQKALQDDLRSFGGLQDATKNQCQFSIIRSDSLLSGNLTDLVDSQFLCSDKSNTQNGYVSIYQGIISFNNSIDYFYNINTANGSIQICTTVGSDYEQINSLLDFEAGCLRTETQNLGKNSLILAENEYVSDVQIHGGQQIRLTFVTIKTRGHKSAFRQVYVNFDPRSTLVPTIDVDTYYYGVSRVFIWRTLKKPSDQFLRVSGYNLTTKHMIGRNGGGN